MAQSAFLTNICMWKISVIQKEMFNFSTSFSVMLLVVALLIAFKLLKKVFYYFTRKVKIIHLYAISNKKVPCTHI